MPLTQKTVTLDCDDVPRVSAFWSAALERPVGDGASPYFAMLPATGPGELTWLFIKVPEPKTVKNRVHPDFVSPDRPAEVTRLIELGAEKVGDYEEWGTRWTTLRDVEGNEFCIGDDDHF